MQEQRQLHGETSSVTEMDKYVDPALWPLVEAFPPIDVSADTLAGFRAAMVELSVRPDPSTHVDVSLEELTIPGGGNAAKSIRCLLFRPAPEPNRRATASALLHIHGGGF